MLRRLLCCAFLALAAAPIALAGGPPAGVLQGGDGVATRGGGERFVAVPTGSATALARVRVRGGSVVGWNSFPGGWGVPLISEDGTTGGLSADGRTLVLGNLPTTYPPRASSFLVLDARTLRLRERISLRGDFGFDALSPAGTRLYLIEHLAATDVSRYVVRAYDLRSERLLPGRIADRTQRGWTMQGFPMTRATSADGRWAYTLYQNPGGYPFVHALDTVRGVAHCVGLPWTGNQDALWNLRLSLRGGGRTLVVRWRSGRRFLAVDTRSWRVSRDEGGGFPWLAAGAAGGAVALALLVLRLLRRRRQEVEHERVEGIGLAQGQVVV